MSEYFVSGKFYRTDSDYKMEMIGVFSCVLKVENDVTICDALSRAKQKASSESKNVNCNWDDRISYHIEQFNRI